MKKSIEKISVSLLVTLLLSSTAFVMLGQAQETVSTTSSLFIAPNPVGISQQVSGIAWIQPDPPKGKYFTNFGLTVTLPDGSEEHIGSEVMTTDAHGVFYFSYTPYQLGVHNFVLHFYGEVFYVGIDSVTVTYAESYSGPFALTVQEEPVPPGVPVLPGDDVWVYPDPEETRISLHFDHITSSGTATVFRTTSPPSGVAPLPKLIGFYYDFQVTFTFTGPVGVGLPYEEEDLTGPESELTMWHYEGSAVADVNGDGKVGWQDLYRIMLAYLSTPRTRRWNSACDLDHDLRIDWKDLAIVLKHFGETGSWVDVTVRVDELKNIVYGSTSNLPPFGIRPR